LLSLWLSQSLYFMGTYGLRIYVVLVLAAEGGGQRDAAWHLTSALFMLPSVFLVPLVGALSNSLPKRRGLLASAGYSAGLMLVFAALQEGWLLCLALIALGSALYTPTRYALLFAAAMDGQLPLPRVISWIEAGAVLSMVGGMLGVGSLFGTHWDHGSVSLFPPPVLMVLTLVFTLSFLAVVPAGFPSDVYRPAGVWEALRGFFHDARRVWEVPETRGSLLAVAYLRAAATAAVGALIADALAHHSEGPEGAWQALARIAIVTIVGTGVGSFLAGLATDRRRSLGLVPPGVVGMTGTLVWAACAPPVPLALCLTVGVFGGFVNVPLLSAYQQDLPPDARGNGMALLNTAGYVAMTGISFILVVLSQGGLLSPVGQLWFVAGLTGLGCAAAWVYLGRGTVALMLRT
jgi:hypothetical protein